MQWPVQMIDLTNRVLNGYLAAAKQEKCQEETGLSDE